MCQINTDPMKSQVSKAISFILMSYSTRMFFNTGKKFSFFPSHSSGDKLMIRNKTESSLWMENFSLKKVFYSMMRSGIINDKLSNMTKIEFILFFSVLLLPHKFTLKIYDTFVYVFLLARSGYESHNKI